MAADDPADEKPLRRRTSGRRALPGARSRVAGRRRSGRRGADDPSGSEQTAEHASGQAPEPARAREPEAGLADQEQPTTAVAGAGAERGADKRRSRRVLRPRDPRLPAPVAAGAVGLVVAILARVLIFGGERVCDAVRGTSSCGTAGGFMLLGIVVVMLYVGARLMRLLAVPEPGVSSALGMTLLAIAIMTVLLDVIFSPWMWVVLPVLAAVLYGLAAWASDRLAQMGSG